MAFTATTEWDVRTTGSDSNGGAFDTASTGTDYSQQDAAQVTYTDLVIGSTNTQLTSAAHPFTSAHVGNMINVTGGTGFTVQRVQIVSVAGAVATCDKACGTASSTGGTGNLGGGLATIPTAIGLVVANNIIHVKAGTYTATSASIGGPTVTCTFIGYQSTHKDGGTKPLITTSANSTTVDNLIKFTTSGIWVIFDNFEFSCTAGTPGSCFVINTTHWTVGALALNRCKAHGFADIINNEDGTYWVIGTLFCFSCEFYSSQYFYNAGGGPGLYVECWGCYLHDFTKDIFGGSPGPATALLDRCILTNSGAANYMATVSGTASQIYRNTIFYKAGGKAIFVPSAATNFAPSCLRMENCIVWGGTYAFDTSAPGSATQAWGFSRFQKNNAIGGQSSGRATSTFATGDGEITLTADPFTNGPGGDFSLNSTAGGGALLKAAGFNNSIPGITNAAGKLDVGAVQSAGAAGGSPVALRPSPIIRPM